jgi:hydroxymethylglutaryl-CoA reductase (NADPH)
MRIPSLLLGKLYVKGSLRNEEGGFQFTLRNVLASGTVVKFLAVAVDRREYPLEKVLLVVNGAERVEAMGISSQAPLGLGLGKEVTVKVRGQSLSAGPHQIVLTFCSKEVGELKVPLRDTIEG